MKYLIWHKLIYLAFISLSYVLFFVVTIALLIFLFLGELSDGSGLVILFGLITLLSSVYCFSGNHRFLEKVLNHQVDSNTFVSEIFCVLVRIVFCYMIALAAIKTGNIVFLVFSPVSLSIWLPTLIYLGPIIPLFFVFCVFGLECIYIFQLTRLKQGQTPVRLDEQTKEALEFASKQWRKMRLIK